MEVKDICHEDVDRIQLAQDGEHWRPLVNIMMNCRVPLRAENLNICVTISVSARILFH